MIPDFTNVVLKSILRLETLADQIRSYLLNKDYQNAGKINKDIGSLTAWLNKILNSEDQFIEEFEDFIMETQSVFSEIFKIIDKDSTKYLFGVFKESMFNTTAMTHNETASREVSMAETLLSNIATQITELRGLYKISQTPFDDYSDELFELLDRGQNGSDYKLIGHKLTLDMLEYIRQYHKNKLGNKLGNLEKLEATIRKSI